MDETQDSTLSAEIERLQAEHRSYAQRLEELVQKPYLSTEEQIEDIARHPGRGPARLAAEPLEKVFGQEGDVLAALGEGRELELEHVEPEEEVLAERVLLDELREAPERRGDDCRRRPAGRALWK